MKHTPGPWQARQNGKTITIDGDVNATYYYGIAQINAHGDHENGIPARRDSVNARLIAAAPELLEACKMLFDAALLTIASGIPAVEIDDAILTARAAITKAEGATNAR